MCLNDYGGPVCCKLKKNNSIYKAISIVIKIIFFMKFPKGENVGFLHDTFLISNVNCKKIMSSMDLQFAESWLTTQQVHFAAVFL